MTSDYVPERGSEEWCEFDRTERPWYRKKRFFLPLGTFLLFAGLVVFIPRPGPTGMYQVAGGYLEAGGSTRAEHPMSFSYCLSQVEAMAERAERRPNVISGWSEYQVVSLPTYSGHLLVTCDGIHNRMTVSTAE
jgi:hypothetical protein